MKNVELKRKGAYSMILRTDGKEHKSLYVVKNFDPTKEDGNQWDCSEFYGSTSCGGTLAFGAADRAVENERLKMDPDQEIIPGLYAVEFTPTSTEIGVLEQLGEKLGSFYALPSSVHEFVLYAFPEKTDENSISLSEMVREMNATGVVENNDILSDHAYFYNAETKTFSSAK